METYFYTDDDIDSINSAIKEGGKVWYSDNIVGVKRKIKEFNLIIQDNKCCYCKRSLYHEFSMVVDVEHILPQDKYEDYIFELKNLSVSCKRCNMEIKKNTIPFITSKADIEQSPFDSGSYLFIHPNLDNCDDHLQYFMINANNINYLHYVKKTKKGNYSYQYFKLKNLEISQLDKLQGGAGAPEISDAVPDAIADSVRSLLALIA